MSGFIYGHNPNADTLDGLDSAAFALLGGRAGGQVLQGGTAANEDLTLEGTAHATKTSSYVILQPTAGNVGINTTSPATPLHVVGAATITGGIRPAADGTAALALCKANGDVVVTVDTTNGLLIVSTNGSPAEIGTRKGANADGNNIWIGGGGNSSIGAVGEAYKGSANIVIGKYSGYDMTTAFSCSTFGYSALRFITTGSYVDAVGYLSGSYIADGSTPNTTSSQSVYLGARTKALADGATNEIVIGYDAIGAGSNTATLGNASITRTVLRGAQELTEIAAPGAGAANTARIYAKDNGAGKTQLMVQFATGGEIQLAIEA